MCRLGNAPPRSFVESDLDSQNGMSTMLKLTREISASRGGAQKGSWSALLEKRCAAVSMLSLAHAFDKQFKFGQSGERRNRSEVWSGNCLATPGGCSRNDLIGRRKTTLRGQVRCG